MAIHDGFFWDAHIIAINSQKAVPASLGQNEKHLCFGQNCFLQYKRYSYNYFFNFFPVEIWMPLLTQAAHFLLFDLGCDG